MWVPTVVLVLVLSAIAGAGVVRAQGVVADAEAPTAGAVGPLRDAVSMLAGGLGLGAVVAFMLEKPGWFAKLPSQVKWWIVFGTCVILPVLAQVALQFIPAEVWVVLDPYWKSIAYGFLAWAGSQAAFKGFIQGTA